MDGTAICNRYDALYSSRSTLDGLFQKIEKFVVPYRGEFFQDEETETSVDWRKRGIFDSTAPIAADLLASSIHSNLTSPMIPWFQLRFRDDELNMVDANKEWLETVQSQIWQTLRESDFNMEVAEVYLDLVSFGTAILFQEELSEESWSGTTFTSIPLRRAYFEHGDDDKALRLFRLLQYTRLQLEDKFPEYDFSDLPDDVDTKHDVIFAVYRRDDVDEVSDLMAPEARPWGYKYVLYDSNKEIDEGGYYRMPAHVVRWKKVSGSRWGHSPAFIALSDIMQLNTVVEMLSEARAKEIDPPVKTTEQGVIGDYDTSAGGITNVIEMDQLDRLLQFNQGLFQGDIEIQRLQESIRSTFYVDKLELKESPAMTATEVLARLDKQQRQFAPTLGRLESDLLDPMIEWTYDALVRNGLIEIPDTIADVDFDIEYTGPIPRSMKNEEAQGTSLWVGELAGLAQMMPEILDIVDTDKLARGLGFARGVPADYMRDEDDVKDIRKQRADQQEAMVQMQALEQAGKAMGAIGDGEAAMTGKE